MVMAMVVVAVPSVLAVALAVVTAVVLAAAAAVRTGVWFRRTIIIRTSGIGRRRRRA
jgi:cation transport ATPase